MGTSYEERGEIEGVDDGASVAPQAEPAAAAAEPAVGAPQPSRDPSSEPPFTHTRASGVWAAVVTSLIVLVVLIVFILENPHEVHVDFFGAHGSLALGVALLLAAVIGGLVVVMAGTTRILQLRYRARRQHRAFTERAAQVAAAPATTGEIRSQ